MEERNAERNAAIYARRCSGLTLKDIAREFRLSRETVRGITQRLERKDRYAAQFSGRALNEATSVGGLSVQKHET
jgi:Mor family transcriptional regulator